MSEAISPSRRRFLKTSAVTAAGAVFGDCGYQFFGEVNIDAQTRDLTVDLRDINGVSVFSKTLQSRP